MPLPRSTIIIALLVLSFNLPAQQPPNSFLIRFTAPSHPSDLQVNYFLLGDFGGVRDAQVKAFGNNGLLIPTQYQQRNAKTLRAILYYPGCVLKLLQIENLDTSPRESDFVCQPLPTIRLEGKVDWASVPYRQGLEVEVQYVAPWSHPFFGIMDGPVMTLDPGIAAWEPDGKFVIDLPGFAADPISSGIAQDAYFVLLIRKASSGNLVTLLQVETPIAATPNRDLKVQGSYPTPVTFTARRVK